MSNTFNTYELVSTELGNFIISSRDLEDDFVMQVGGMTWGDNIAGTAVFWAGDNAPQDVDEFYLWAQAERANYERGEGDERMFTARIMLAAKDAEGERKNVDELRNRIQTETEAMLAGFDPDEFMEGLMVETEFNFAEILKTALDQTIEQSEICGCADCVDFVNEVKDLKGE